MTSSSNKLNILTVGTNPNLVYYSYKFQQTGKFNVFYINEDLTVSEPIILKDEGLQTDLQLQPKVATTSFGDFNTALSTNSKIKFDIVFLSANSLQELSNVAPNLTPFLNKSSILIIESTGSVQLEPYLKNIPQFKELHLAIFSIVSTVDVRRTPVANQYVNMTDLKSREIYLGDAQISPSKYGKGPQQNLGALTKLFSIENRDNLRVVVRSTHQEFLTEQWKHAIPEICFNPLLILFEEASPLKLTEQILAKPLLSGLVTELITVCKSMGCKLPLGFDNESNLLKSWVESCSSNAVNSNANDGGLLPHIASPKLFYDFFNSNPLNIDMILLQPILLADDYGIKTPYLEFLYATLCRLEKMNYSSLFFIRRESVNAQIKENQRISQELYEAQNLIEEMKIEKEDKSHSVYAELDQEKGKTRDLLSKLAENTKLIQGLQFNHQQDISAFEKTKADLKRVQAELEQAKQQAQAAQRRSVSPLKGSRSSVNLLQQVMAGNEEPSAVATQETKYTETGTPDLGDLREAALISDQFTSSTPRASAVLDQADTSTNTVIETPTQAQDVSIPNIGNDSSLSVKEIELAKKEQMLATRELEFNKKLQQLRSSQQNPISSITQNTIFAQQQQPQTTGPPQHLQAPAMQQQQQSSLQPALQPRLKTQSSQPQLNKMNSMGQYPVPQSPSMSQNGQFGNFRRINSGMIIDAESYNQVHRVNQQQQPHFPYQQHNGSQIGMNNNNKSGAPPVFRKADRKNRKSSMPITTAANFQIAGGPPMGPLMNNNGQRRSTMTMGNPNMMAGANMGHGSSSMVANGNLYQQKQNQNQNQGQGQFHNSRIQAPQPMGMRPQPQQFQMDSSRSSSGGAAGNAATGGNQDSKLTTPPPTSSSQQQQQQHPLNKESSVSPTPLEQPQVYKSSDGYITPVSNEAPVSTDQAEDQEVKPLGSIAAANKDINYGTTEKKKKFGLFGKKKK
ncbi:hypothetical protein WICPIJ_005656 [Wickerhamomyces pijperi]|uniref:Ketopantoate reductase C-terminal domain-containing protein n=1 Tax=Wickerhamomyces pijperi TaxID=599730 RepID=A0A9P8Q5B3_WICPI|nr:hypothetical protein WICPIJ_005656 [Wickerhamomyces pijperi]